VAPGFPKFASGGVAINGESQFAPVTEDAWEWRVGGHQVCRKWLKDRKRRTLTMEEMATYGRIVTAAIQTRRLATEIDGLIQQHGGWPEASFRTCDATYTTFWDQDRPAPHERCGGAGLRMA
jgi:hypothetical protein